jgi:subtilisin family serine protease
VALDLWVFGWGSNYGPTSVDLFAPGNFILSTYLSDYDYTIASGTSFAAPHVSGACALVWSKYPSLSYSDLIARILSGVDKKPAFAGKCVTGGRLNLYNSIKEAKKPHPKGRW